MGFLDNLLKKEAQKIISSVVENVTDSVKENFGTPGTANNSTAGKTVADSASVSTPVSGSYVASNGAAQSAAASAAKKATSSARRKASGMEGETGDDEDCCYDDSLIRSRIEKVAAEDWPSYELRKNIPATEVGGGAKDQGFDYGLYLDGQPKLMIMVLDQYQYRNKCVQRSHKVCKDKGIGSFHLLQHLPNRKTYIAERMKECMPD